MVKIFSVYILQNGRQFIIETKGATSPFICHLKTNYIFAKGYRMFFEYLFAL